MMQRCPVLSTNKTANYCYDQIMTCIKNKGKYACDPDVSYLNLGVKVFTFDHFAKDAAFRYADPAIRATAERSINAFAYEDVRHDDPKMRRHAALRWAHKAALLMRGSFSGDVMRIEGMLRAEDY